MKKSLIALAVLAASGAAMAQSSVTLFGVVDATYAYGSGSIANRSSLTNSGYNSSRLGFRGVEDLGGGLSASFWLEAGLNNDNGTGGSTNTNNQAATSTGGGLVFNRRSTVSLNGGFGEVRLGRDYTPQFWNKTVFDPFGTNGVGTNVIAMDETSLGGPTRTRASNSIGYFLPGNLGGFYGQAQYYLGENLSNAANKKDGNGLAARVGYANGPINVALAASQTKYLTGNIKAWNLGGQYDLGVAKILAQYDQDKVSGGADGKGFLIGGLVPVGAGEVRLAYSTYKIETAGADPRVNKIALGYVHNLSKRTALYATYAHLTNKNGAAVGLNGSVTAAGDNSNGYDFGIRHSF
jgi:predicted porin